MTRLRTGSAGGAGRRALALALAPCLSGCILTTDTLPTGSVRRRAADLPRGLRQAACRAAGARLVARLPLARTDLAGRARASRQSRHRGRGRAHRAGRRADAHRRRAAAAADQCRPLGDAAPGTGANGGNSSYSAVLNASYEIDFWGKNRAALRAAEFTAVASRFDREVDRPLDRCDASSTPISRSSPRRTGCASRATTSARRRASESLSGPDRRRHRDRSRYRAAGIARRAAARRDPAARSATAPEHCDARAAARRAARAPHGARRKPERHHGAAPLARPAVGPVVAAPRHSRGGGAARLRQRQCRRARARRCCRAFR